jgi:hypothetical protein
MNEGDPVKCWEFILEVRSQFAEACCWDPRVRNRSQVTRSMSILQHIEISVENDGAARAFRIILPSLE